MRKFSEFNGSEFGPWEYQAEGPEAPFYYVGDWGKSWVSKSKGEGYNLGEDKEEKLVDNSNRENNLCDFGAGRRISNNCGWYGARKLPLKLDDEIDFDGWKKLEKMMGYVSRHDAKGIENMWKNRTVEFEEELFGVFKGRDFWVEKMGKDGTERINLTVNELGELISFLEKGKDILNEDWNKGEIIEGGQMNLIKGKTRTLWRMIRNYWTERNSDEKISVSKTKDLELVEAGVNFFSGREGQVGFSCISRGQQHETEMKGFFDECQNEMSSKEVKVSRVIKTVFAQNDGRVFIPKRGNGVGWESQTGAFESKGWLEGGVWGIWGRFTGVRYKPKSGIMKLVLSETCTEDRMYVGTLRSLVDGEKRIKYELCKEITKPWFGDEVSNKRVCYFKFKNGPQNYLRRWSFFNGMLKIPVWYKDAEGYWAKCSVHGI